MSNSTHTNPTHSQTQTHIQTLGSDNHSPVHPAVFEEFAQVNIGHVIAYGDDPYTAEAIDILKKHFGDACDIYFTFNGTGANVVALSGLLNPWEGVLCARSAHINCDEAGAPERIGNVKLIPIDTPDGKLSPARLEPYIADIGNEHAVQPRVISVSNLSEKGTVYTPDELRFLCEWAHEHGLYVHCDGARLANAAAALGVSLTALTADAGIDALSFGGTKNGLMGAEAVVWFGSARPQAGFWIRKQCGQLASKSRYVAAQFSALYRKAEWLECARHANAMAARLAEGLREHECELVQTPDGNEIFCTLPSSIIEPLQKDYFFYVVDEAKGEVRLVCSWDTDPAFIESFLTRLGELLRIAS
ncbi:MAG: beta-eliminating lyase-related protein [Coriobacteriia bacterium]|nr:beta-eliminating lyase-related protein [Coriobacteriia bacterium]